MSLPITNLTLRNTFIECLSLKLHALNRISRFLSPEQHVLIINAYIKSLFIYCPLVWMFFYRGIMHKMNKIHQRSLRLLLKNYKDNFQDLSRSSGYMSIHYFMVSISTHGLSPEIIKEVFSTRASIYNTQRFNVFQTHIPTLNRYLTKSTNSGTYFLKTSNHLF